MAKCDSNEIEFNWEWLNSTGSSSEWTSYDKNLQKFFNEALESKQTKVKFDANNVKFELDLSSRMSQKNLTTHFERAVRFCVLDRADKNKSFSYWQWHNDNKEWMHYTPYITLQLEENYEIFKSDSAKNSFILTLSETNTKYLFDFSKMSQTNQKSGYSRRIKRGVSDATNIDKEEPVEVKQEARMDENEENDRPSSNLRKRKGTLTSADKKPSLASTVSVSSTDSEATTSKRAKKASIKQEPVEEAEEDKKIEPVKSGRKVNKQKPVKSAKRLKREPQDEEDEEEEEEEKPTKSGRKTKQAKSNGKVKKENNDDQEEETEASTSKPTENIKTIKFTGDIPLDEKFTEIYSHDYSIYREGDVVYDAMLNQTNLQFNNNKYYLIQLVEKKSSKAYYVWFRWGRVGKVGQCNLQSFGNDLNEAKSVFSKKFFEKTKNDWDSKDSFEKYPGKYDLVHKDYSATNNKANLASGDQAEQPKVETPPSKLDKKLQNLIELICNVTEMENLLKEMKFDAEKAPLGKLSKNQIKAGYAALKEIEEHIVNKSFGASFIQANNDFYTRIPHDFGMRTPPLIRTPQQMREKMRLLEILDDIEVAVTALNQESDIKNPVDRHYDQLECQLKPLDPSDKIFNLIEQYLLKNHAMTHSNYKLKLLEVYEAEKKGEQERFKDVGNRMLLWHGSRITNWAGILSQGLRIAPPEAPVTGYMFGKGCYFSDCSSKSANYCYTNSIKNVGLLSLSEVSLGVCNELKQADNNADKLPSGKMSVKGVGKSEPDQAEWVKLDDGCVMPIGKLKQKVDQKDAHNYSLLYNEFIVYDVAQIKLRYLVKVEFDYED